MLTEKQAFKFGFLYRCAEEGLSDVQTSERIKLASELVKKGGITNTLGWLAALTGGGILGAGGLTGYAAGRAETPEADANDIRKRELIDAYNSMAHNLETRAQAAQILGMKPFPRSKKINRRVPKR